MDIRTIELVPRPLEAVRLTEEDASAIRQWVQDRTGAGMVVLAPDRSLYIQGVSGTEKVELGEWILYDLTDDVFTSATDGAIRAFYREVSHG